MAAQKGILKYVGTEDIITTTTTSEPVTNI